MEGLTFPKLEKSLQESSDDDEETPCGTHRSQRTNIEESLAKVRELVTSGAISQNLLAELIDLRKRHPLAQIPEVVRILREHGKEKDQDIARAALIIAKDCLPVFRDCEYYDDLVYEEHCCRCYWRAAYGNPVEGQEINHSMYGAMIATDVGVFTMNLQEA